MVAEKFQKMYKMKLLSSLQLATLLAYFSKTMVQATSHQIFVSIAR